jgi:hypothetical protein
MDALRLVNTISFGRPQKIRKVNKQRKHRALSSQSPATSGNEHSVNEVKNTDKLIPVMKAQNLERKQIRTVSENEGVFVCRRLRIDEL